MAQTCYRHPNRETGVSCSSCGRPICPECMTPTPVGMRCPECARQRTKVVRNPTGTPGNRAFPATVALIAINVAVYLVEILRGPGGLSGISPQMYFEFALNGVEVAGGEWYRLVTGGFLHREILHILLNMLALFVGGRLVEPAIGTPRFLALYFASLLAGSFGALLISGPDAFTVGASGAIFGIFGAAFVIARGRGSTAVASELGIVIVLNLVFTLGIPGISVGSHFGGLIGGAICGAAIVAGERGYFGPRRREAEYLAMLAVAVISVLGALAVA
ncbi:MAG: rhomboid family intramembrane serine protease [Solirubrobacterales bacterium]